MNDKERKEMADSLRNLAREQASLANRFQNYNEIWSVFRQSEICIRALADAIRNGHDPKF